MIPDLCSTCNMRQLSGMQDMTQMGQPTPGMYPGMTPMPQFPGPFTPQMQMPYGVGPIQQMPFQGQMMPMGQGPGPQMGQVPGMQPGQGVGTPMGEFPGTVMGPPVDFQMQPGPPVQEDIGYTQGYLRTQIGRRVKIEFLIGSNMFIDREGTLTDVGISYVIIREVESDDLVLCDIYSIRFVKFYY